jgi:predicted component of type VI protein secretion system
MILLSLIMRTHPTLPSVGHVPMKVGPSADALETAIARLRAALHAAAEAAVEAGVDLEPWMQAAWAAYIEHRPGLRQHLEDVQLANQIEELRQRGQVGEA